MDEGPDTPRWLQRISADKDRLKCHLPDLLKAALKLTSKTAANGQLAADMQWALFCSQKNTTEDKQNKVATIFRSTRAGQYGQRIKSCFCLERKTKTAETSWFFSLVCVKLQKFWSLQYLWYYPIHPVWLTCLSNDPNDITRVIYSYTPDWHIETLRFYRSLSAFLLYLTKHWFIDMSNNYFVTCLVYRVFSSLLWSSLFGRQQIINIFYIIQLHTE